MTLLKSVLHNIGVVIVGLGVAALGLGIDALVGLTGFYAAIGAAVGGALILGGFVIRVWATVHFYRHRMSVIALAPQASLVTAGPYRFSRNPLYLGGNVLIFFGAAIALGSPSALALTAIHLPVVDRFIRREERQLEARFGDEFVRYKSRVRRWI